MKRIIALLLSITTVICLGLSLASCDFIKENTDEAYAYDYAIIRMPDGEEKTVELKGWKLRFTDCIEIYYVEETYYITHTRNCTLVDYPDVDIDITQYENKNFEDLNFGLYANACFFLPDGTLYSGEIEYSGCTSNPVTIHLNDGGKYMVNLDNCVLWK